MFPIIPYNLTSRAMYAQDGLGGKVLAGCDLPKDSWTGVICGENLCGKVENINMQLEVDLNEDKKIVLKTKKYVNKCHWIRTIRLADDCHSYNAKLCLQNTTDDPSNIHFAIQITKFIRSGQELLLWFSEDILAHLQMAFLTPANIQGQKKYVCHHCCTTFEYPNPLKLHLTLDCDKQQISVIWDRLAKLSIALKSEPKSSFGFQLLKTNTKEKYSILNLSKSTEEKTIEYKPLKLSVNLPFPVATKSSTSPTIEIQRPFSEPATIHSSAFKPYSTKKISHNHNNHQIRLSQSVSNFTTLTQNLSLNCHSQPVMPPQNYQNLVDLNHAAQMETLVSNLGKSKQGHLCIYCGKCYSRKYGLKIHIRTHTGYKPLKCKYCLRPFGDPSNLNKHVRLHAEGDTPYKCELCGKILVRRRDLERHLRSRHMGEIHLGEKIEEIVNSSSDHSDD